MKPLVYIAAPYTKPDPVENTRAALDVATMLVDTGSITPIVPHLSLFWHLVYPKPVDYWYRYDLEVMARCDAVLRLPGESTGADTEVAMAREQGIPVFDDISAVIRWADHWPAYRTVGDSPITPDTPLPGSSPYAASERAD